ncbi:MAG: hypothetical protein JO153_04720 [Solirubrobacterales bacterium]|nr:hypothetical protein [Solirubrobacterales bacterium]MBV9915786.1 hypothetical protein [Solirubrobacterales bacterium]
MTSSPDSHPPGGSADERAELFEQLRQRNERRAKLAQQMRAERQLHLKVERVIQAHRKRRPPTAR